MGWIFIFWLYVYFNWRFYNQGKEIRDTLNIRPLGLVLPALTLAIHIANLCLFHFTEQNLILHPLLSNPVPLSILSLLSVDIILRRIQYFSTIQKSLSILVLIIFSISLAISSQQSPSFYRQFLSNTRYCPLSKPTLVTTFNNEGRVYETENTYQLIYNLDTSPELIFCQRY